MYGNIHLKYVEFEFFGVSIFQLQSEMAEAFQIPFSDFPIEV